MITFGTSFQKEVSRLPLQEFSTIQRITEKAAVTDRGRVF